MMSKAILSLILVSTAAYADTRSQLNLYNQARLVAQNAQQEEKIRSIYIKPLLQMVDEHIQDIFESVIIINLAFNDYAIKCDSPVATQIVTGLNTNERLRFNYGLDFSCDDNGETDGVRQIIRYRLM